MKDMTVVNVVLKHACSGQESRQPTPRAQTSRQPSANAGSHSSMLWSKLVKHVFRRDEGHDIGQRRVETCLLGSRVTPVGLKTHACWGQESRQPTPRVWHGGGRDEGHARATVC